VTEPAARVVQRAEASGFARVFQAAGDLVVYEGGEPYRLAGWPLAEPGDGAEAVIPERPSALLRAGNALVGFAGRAAERAWLREWRDGPGGVRVCLVHGPGGQGKTRLASQLAREWAAGGWAVLGGFHRRDRQAPDAFEVPAALDDAAGLLLVVDYAERWETADLLTLLRDTRGRAGRDLPVRVLLLARPAGPWWQNLAYRIGNELRVTAWRYELAPLENDPGLSRAGLYAAARDAFAQVLGVPGAAAGDPPRELETHDDYRLVLTVHMAALAAVLAHGGDGGHGGHGPGSLGDPVEVSAFLLARERDHWQALHARAEDPVSVTPDAMAQLVYTATLTGPLSHRDGTAAVRRAEVESPQAPGQMVKDHARCYPPPAPGDGEPGAVRPMGAAVATVLEPLYPDRLGEDYLALLTPGHPHEHPADPWTEQAPARLLAPPPGADAEAAPVWSRHALTTLVEASARWDHLAHGQLYPLLRAHPHLALRAGGAALATLAAHPHIDVDLLEAIDALLPGRHIDLDTAAAALAARLAGPRLAATGDPARHAGIHEKTAHRLGNAGQDDRALAHSTEALALRRALAHADPGTHSPDLAAALDDHAIRLSNAGRPRQALTHSTEALALRRALVRDDPGAYLPDLARSLNNHALRLSETGQHDQALTHSTEALLTYRELVRAAPDAHLPGLARSLGNHALRLAGTGQHDQALTHSTEALQTYRRLVRVNRDAHLPGLARSLDGHALHLTDAGRHDEALAHSAEALLTYRELVRTVPDAYRPNLAAALDNHALQLADAGRHDQALAHSAEALQTYRRLVATNRPAYLPNLAAALDNHASHLTDTGRPDEALAHSTEALLTFRELVATNRAAHLPGLAGALYNHAQCLADTGRRGEALTHAAETVRAYRELAAANRAAHLPDLVWSLALLGSLLVEDGQPRASVTPTVEALVATPELPDHKRGAGGPLADTLRRAYAADPAGVKEQFRADSGEELPTALMEPGGAQGG
jgi:tetratricopeptide (TPR) repeat protein